MLAQPAILERIIPFTRELSIIIGRLATAVRSIVPLLSGVSGLPAAKYMRYDIIACAIWVSGLGLLVAGFGGLLS